MDAGELRERIEILSFRKEENAYQWHTERMSWAKAERAGRRRIFSTHAASSEGINFIIRRQALTRANAIRFAGQHYLITSIVPHGRLHFRVETAAVQLAVCADKYENFTFPSVLSEIYARHDSPLPMDSNVTRYVLVTPKEISLVPGRLVEVNGAPWPIRVGHTLDEWKNEYEIERTVEL